MYHLSSWKARERQENQDVLEARTHAARMQNARDATHAFLGMTISIFRISVSRPWSFLGRRVWTAPVSRGFRAQEMRRSPWRHLAADPRIIVGQGLCEVFCGTSMRGCPSRTK